MTSSKIPKMEPQKGSLTKSASYCTGAVGPPTANLANELTNQSTLILKWGSYNCFIILTLKQKTIPYIKVTCLNPEPEVDAVCLRLGHSEVTAPSFVLVSGFTCNPSSQCIGVTGGI